MSIKDPIQAFVDEITLLRNELADLKRTSLNKDEAAAINKTILTGVERMSQIGALSSNGTENSLKRPRWAFRHSGTALAPAIQLLDR